MKAFVKEFVKRGCLFCGGGPLILAVIYLFVAAGGTVQSVPVGKLVTEILTSLLLAFIAAGISAVHTVDRLQLPNALLIHGAVLFADDVLLFGWVSGEEETPMKRRSIVEKIRSYLQTITADKDFVTSVLNVGDGVAVSVYLGKGEEK